MSRPPQGFLPIARDGLPPFSGGLRQNDMPINVAFSVQLFGNDLMLIEAKGMPTKGMWGFVSLIRRKERKENFLLFALRCCSDKYKTFS